MPKASNDFSCFPSQVSLQQHKEVEKEWTSCQRSRGLSFKDWNLFLLLLLYGSLDDTEEKEFWEEKDSIIKGTPHSSLSFLCNDWCIIILERKEKEEEGFVSLDSSFLCISFSHSLQETVNCLFPILLFLDILMSELNDPWRARSKWRENKKRREEVVHEMHDKSNTAWRSFKTCNLDYRNRERFSQTAWRGFRGKRRGQFLLMTFQGDDHERKTSTHLLSRDSSSFFLKKTEDFQRETKMIFSTASSFILLQIQLCMFGKKDIPLFLPERDRALGGKRQGELID